MMPPSDCLTQRGVYASEALPGRGVGRKDECPIANKEYPRMKGGSRDEYPIANVQFPRMKWKQLVLWERLVDG
jgi:hypothetical protein